MRKICIITGTRAEYGLLRWVMQGIKDDPDLSLQIIATGMHLSPEFGLTYQEILQDGFQIDHKVEMLTSSDTPVGIAKSMGLGLIGFADALNELKPDILVVLGDRYEIFSAVSAALPAKIPVAHIHGGETTEGSIDEAFRHAITKMAHLHFVAANEYSKRVIQLGENPKHIFLVGGLGVDNIKRIKLLNKSELESALNFKLGKNNLLITFHPPTLEKNTGENQMKELLTALQSLKNTKLIFTLSNSDSGGRKLNGMINDFVSHNSNACVYYSLGSVLYLSCMSQMDGVIGNSSSGLLEAPSLGIGSINIGDRQAGRLKANTVIDCEPFKESIEIAINKLYSDSFKEVLKNVVNPYGNGGAAKKIIEKLKSASLEKIEKKKFFDLHD
jgi:GDP/UDP-N,N'-diacetylbacillosamine 2-epimerase (hydrolysing)